MAIQDYCCVHISSALVPNTPSEITIGHYLIDDCFFAENETIKRVNARNARVWVV
jgi:hypothetical protein